MIKVRGRIYTRFFSQRGNLYGQTRGIWGMLPQETASSGFRDHDDYLWARGGGSQSGGYPLVLLL